MLPFTYRKQQQQQQSSIEEYGQTIIAFIFLLENYQLRTVHSSSGANATKHTVK